MNLIICTVAYNRPRYIPYQYECLKKYITVPFEYYVFDNSDDTDMINEIKRNCNYLDVQYIRVPQELNKNYDMVSKSSNGIDYALRFIYHSRYFRKYLMLIDPDVFLTKPYDPIAQLGNNDILGIRADSDYIYYKKQFLIFNLATLPDFNRLSFLPCYVDGVKYDCGGHFINYKKANPTIKDIGVKYIKSGFYNSYNIESAPTDLHDYLKSEIQIINSGSYANKSFSEIIDDAFIHLRAGSNWFGYSDDVVFKREDNLFTFLCNNLIDWNIKPDINNKYLICFSLYGNNPRYTYNGIINAILARKIYKGWICRYYYDSSVPLNIIDILRSFDNVELVKMASSSDKPTGDKMFWRFYPASESNVAVMISRDCDSWLSFREACSVKKWINSDKQFHIIRDHCYHSLQIMGGTWGAKRGTCPEMYEICQEYVKNNIYDQGFLAEKIYPKILNTLMVHVCKNQTKMGGAPSNGYFPDGAVELENYFKIMEYIPTIDIEMVNEQNTFNCLHCGINHQFFIGGILEKYNEQTKKYFRSIGL